LDNTIIIVAADHGEEFGEHGVMSHGLDLNMPALHVPLLIEWPAGVPEDLVVKEPVTLRDLPATVMALLGMDQGSPIPGESWTRIWDGTDRRNENPAFLSRITSFDPARSLVAGRFHYIRLLRDGARQEELYDVQLDPTEQTDLASDTAYREVLDRLRRRMDATATDPNPQ